MTSLRIFFVGGVIAYRALFNWISPWIYIPTMLGSPLFQILFFAYLGRFAGVADDTFFVVGNAVQVCGMSCVYGMTMTIANERWFSTLSPLLATPANRFALFMGRALPIVVNGIFVSVFGFFVGWLFLDFNPPASSIAPLAVILLVSVCSCTAFGMVLGSIGLRARDVFFAGNLAYYLLLLFCGVNVPFDDMPAWIQHVGSCLPLTHGIEAARGVVDGATLGDVSGLVMTELAIGITYTAFAFALFRYFEFASRKSAALEAL